MKVKIVISSGERIVIDSIVSITYGLQLTNVWLRKGFKISITPII